MYNKQLKFTTMKNTKNCPRCNEEKLMNEFGFQPRNNDGRQTYCKGCAYKANQKSKMKNSNAPHAVEGFTTEKEHFNAALEQYAKVFNMPSLLNHKRK